MDDMEFFENFLTESYVVSGPALKVGRRTPEQSDGEDLLGDPPVTSAASDDDCSNLHSAGADASASFSLLTSVVISALVLSSLCFMLLRCVGQRLR